MYSISSINVAEYKSSINILYLTKAAIIEFDDAMVSDSMTKYDQTFQSEDNRKDCHHQTDFLYTYAMTYNYEKCFYVV